MLELEKVIQLKLPRPTITLLDTSVTDMESSLLALANRARVRAPEAFSGDHSLVYIRAPYTPPYAERDFRFLKDIAVAMRHAAGMRWAYNFAGVICVDISAWTGHYQEHLFEVLLQYLYDRTRDSSLLLQLKGSNCDIQMLERACIAVGWPNVNKASVTLSDKEDVLSLLQECIRVEKRQITPDALELLACAIQKYADYLPKRVMALRRIVEDLTSSLRRDATVINKNHVTAYFSNQDSLLCRLTGRKFYEKDVKSRERF